MNRAFSACPCGHQIRGAMPHALTENSAFGAKQSKCEKACGYYSPFPLVPQRSVKRANSATDCTFIFAITWARCILTVASVMPRSPAICLFNLPETTCSSTSRSRGVSESRRARISESLACSRRATVSLSIAARTAVSRSLSFTGLERKSNAPLFHRLHTLRNITVAGEKNNRQDAAFFGERSLKLEAVEVRHSHIKHEASGRGWICTAQEIPWVTQKRPPQCQPNAANAKRLFVPLHRRPR